ncbi:hypothetical protein ACH5RR_023700 [Cinchona calisaya]|uniref:F-box domain-containing protein n=1 Tax=Cinchona calisaya TaxID=153742 RepID=A0ABD2ZGF8_9GENT
MAEIQEIITGEITGLPEPILHRILTFLPIKEAIRTSILSKAFLNASHANPTLEFSDELFFNNRFNGSSHWMWDQKLKIIIEKYESFCEYVNGIVKRYHEEKTGIENFTLELDDDQICECDSQFVERCTKVAVENGVRCLYLSIEKFIVPQFVLGAKSPLNLRIRMCNMIMTRHDQKIMCDRLKQLHLRSVCLDDEMLHKILKSCQLIEVVEIWNCNGLKNVNVTTKIDNLKKCTVALLNSPKVEVSLAPRLESLICWHNTTKSDGEWIPCGINLTASEYPNLKILSLRSIGRTSEIF